MRILAFVASFMCGCLLFSVPLYFLFASSVSEKGKPPASTASAVVAPELSAKEIADKVESVYRNAGCLCVYAQVVQENIDGNTTVPIRGGYEPIQVESVMVKDSFMTLIRDKDGRLVRGFCLEDGVFQEYRAVDGGEPEIIAYKPPHPHGTDNPRLYSDYDCLVGTQTFSWVGVPADNKLPIATDRARSMRQKIENGVREADVVERNIDCYVFRQKIPVGENVVIENVVYIDKNTFDVRRWDTISSGVHRKRLYGVLTFATPPESIPFLWRKRLAEVEGKI